MMIRRPIRLNETATKETFKKKYKEKKLLRGFSLLLFLLLLLDL